MLTREENERLTRIDGDAEMGRLMRENFWIPAMLSMELVADGPPKLHPVAIRLMSREIDIPAGDADYLVEDEYTIVGKIRLQPYWRQECRAAADHPSRNEGTVAAREFDFEERGDSRIHDKGPIRAGIECNVTDSVKGGAGSSCGVGHDLPNAGRAIETDNIVPGLAGQV